MRKKQYKLFGGVFALLLIQSCVFGAASLYASGLWDEPEAAIGSRISEGEVAGLSLKGLTLEEARASLREKLVNVSGLPLLLTLEQRTFPLDKEKLGLRFELDETLKRVEEHSGRSGGIAGLLNRLTGEARDGQIPLAAAYDRDELVRQVEEIARKVEQQARAATLQIEQESAVIVPEVIGYRVDVEKTVAAVEKELQTLRSGLQIPLKVEQELPPMGRKDLEKSVHLLAEWRAPLNTAIPNRLDNVKRAAERINGTILLPNQSLSFNELAGPFTAAKGYRPSEEPKRDSVPDGLNGSASLVASALYETAVLSGLEVIERHSTKRPVDFQRLGMEALVDGQELDLRLANRLAAPVYIHAAVEQGRLRVALFGALSAEKEKPLLMTEMSEFYAPGTIVRVDRTLQTNQERIVQVGEKGVRVKVYLYYPAMDRKVLVADNLYQPIPNVIAVGPKIEGSARTENEEDDWPTEVPYGSAGADQQSSPQGEKASSAIPADRVKPPDLEAFPSSSATPAPGGSSMGTAGTETIENQNGVIILQEAPER